MSGLHWPGLAICAAAGILVAVVAHAVVPGEEARAPVETGVLDTITSNFPPALAAPGRKATVVLRATFVADGVYADPQVVETQVHAGAFDADERERLGEAAVRTFKAVSRWRLRAPPDATLPAPGSQVVVRVKFVMMLKAQGRD